MVYGACRQILPIRIVLCNARKTKGCEANLTAVKTACARRLAVADGVLEALPAANAGTVLALI